MPFQKAEQDLFFVENRQKKLIKLDIDFHKARCYNSYLLSGNAKVAQSVEQRFRKPQVKGSSPFFGSMIEV